MGHDTPEEHGGRRSGQAGAYPDVADRQMLRVLRFIKMLKRRQEKLAQRASGLEEEADAMAWLLEELEALICSGSIVLPRKGPRGGTTGGLSRVSAAGVEAEAESLDIKPLASGKAKVRIDAGEALVVPPRLAEFLQIISGDFGDEAGALVGWKTLEEVGRRLEKRVGKAVTRHNVSALVYRLRNALQRQGIPPSIVQTNARLGVRFALRRTVTPQTPTISRAVRGERPSGTPEHIHRPVSEQQHGDGPHAMPPGRHGLGGGRQGHGDVPANGAAAKTATDSAVPDGPP